MHLFRLVALSSRNLLAFVALAPSLFGDSLKGARTLDLRPLSTAICIAIVLGCHTLARGESSSELDRPNIILIFTDDQSYKAIGSHGNPQVQTPNMDRMAEEGVVFSNHYNSTAICMASRASIMTGMYEYKTGCNFLHGPMHKSVFEKSYPVLLRDAGYRTGFAGKFGFAVDDGGSWNEKSYKRLPIEEFDSWAGGLGQTSYVTAKNKYLAKYADRYPHSSRAYGAYAQDFIKESAQDKRPFCLTLFFKAPHRPFTPDPLFDDVYEGVTFEKPDNYGRDAGQHLSLQSRLGRQYLHFFMNMGFDQAHYQETMRRYYQLIYGVDYALGMLRKQLAQQMIDDNTIIILTSDNGFFCGAHGFGGKVLPYEEGSKAPLIVLDPRKNKSVNHRTADALTGTVDIAPTILDYAGVPVPTQMDGLSLSSVVNQEKAKVRDYLPLFQVWGAPTTFSMSIVTPDYKYIYWCYGDGMEPAEELFNVTDDPGEMRNVRGDSKLNHLLSTMRQRYDNELSKWRTGAVPYNDYQQFATILDRTSAWSLKKPLIPEHMWKQYTYLGGHLGIDQEEVFDYEKVLEAAGSKR